MNTLAHLSFARPGRTGWRETARTIGYITATVGAFAAAAATLILGISQATGH